jgi:hypothetical protein
MVVAWAYEAVALRVTAANAPAAAANFFSIVDPLLDLRLGQPPAFAEKHRRRRRLSGMCSLIILIAWKYVKSVCISINAYILPCNNEESTAECLGDA